MAQNYCPNCGAELQYKEAEICPSCGVRIRPPEPARKKEPVLAALLSFIFAGSGQVYNGELGKGILILAGTIIGAFVFLIPGIIVWVFGMYYAYTSSEKMNKGEIPLKEASGESIIAYILAFVAIIIIAVLLAIFVVALFFVPVFAGPF
ncbi:MAG: zinc-ribbon domain-containing protein [Methanoregulaceae archaeon]|nr:zinc-ribbon domain-containing protein [Methanoregulaceae archaeon]